MGEMAAGIAHEINQPLSAIANYAQAAKHMLGRGSLKPDSLKSACGGIADEVQRAGSVLENLRNFIRKREIEKESVNLNDVIKGALTLVSVDSGNADVAVFTKFADGLPPVRGNPVQLQQVLLNLTRNAVDATKGAIGSRRAISISTRQPDPTTVEFRVSDRGPGVSPNLADAIFHPFVTTKVEGLGVGLAISRTIVEAHGGQLTYEDNPEGGAIFVVTLPLDSER
jgi:two-component system sensor kinase FixL